MRKPSDVDFPFLWNIFRRRYQYVLAFGIFCAALTFVYLKYIAKPVYCVNFSLFAWDYAGSSDDISTATSRTNEAIQATNMIDRDLMVADKMLNDYEKLMNSRYVTDRVKTQLINLSRKESYSLKACLGLSRTADKGSVVGKTVIIHKVAEREAVAKKNCLF